MSPREPMTLADKLGPAWAKFIPVPPVLLEQRLSAGAKIVAQVLLDHRDLEEVYPSQGTISELAGMSVKATGRALGELEEAGLIGRSRRWKSNGARDSDLIDVGPLVPGLNRLAVESTSRREPPSVESTSRPSVETTSRPDLNSDSTEGPSVESTSTPSVESTEYLELKRPRTRKDQESSALHADGPPGDRFGDAEYEVIDATASEVHATEPEPTPHERWLAKVAWQERERRRQQRDPFGLTTEPEPEPTLASEEASS